MKNLIFFIIAFSSFFNTHSLSALLTDGLIEVFVLPHSSNMEISITNSCTPLHIAAAKGDIQTIQSIATKTNVDARNKHHNTPLHLAILNGQFEATQALIQANANINAQNCSGNTPLHFAASLEQTHIIQLLLEGGAHSNIKNNEGYTPLNLAIPIKKNIESIIDLIIHKKNKHHQNTSLHEASINGNLNDIEYFLQNKADINMQNVDGYTPLHLALLSGQIKAAQLLIQKGANKNIMNYYHCNPLMASIYGHCNISHIIMLIQHESAITTPTCYGYTPFQATKDHNKFQLIDHTDVNTRDKYGNTPLHWAAQNGLIDAVQHLINRGADVNKKNIYGNSPLHESIKNGHINCANTLINSGSNPDAFNTYGNTALHEAAWQGNKDAADLLIEHGAQKNMYNMYGQLPDYER